MREKEEFQSSRQRCLLGKPLRYCQTCAVRDDELVPVRNPVLEHRALVPLVVGNRTQNSRVAGARPNHQAILVGREGFNTPMRFCRRLDHEAHVVLVSKWGSNFEMGFKMGFAAGFATLPALVIRAVPALVSPSKERPSVPALQGG